MATPRKPKPFGSFPVAPRHESFNAPLAEGASLVDPAPDVGVRLDRFAAPDEIAVLVDEAARASADREDLVSPRTPRPAETFAKARADVSVDPLARGIADLQRLTLDAIKITVEAQMDFVAALAHARTPSEAIAAHNACARRQYEATAARWLDLASVVRRLATRA